MYVSMRSRYQRRGATAALLAAALSACSMIPTYAPPPIAVPTGWSEGTAEPAAWPAPDWWRNFGSPTLEALVATAVANNTDIAAAAARIVQADAQARIAGAPLLPSLEASADAGRVWRNRSSSSFSAGDGSTSDLFDSFGVGGGGRSSRSGTSYGLDFSARYQLDLFGANRAALASAEASRAFSRFDRETVRLTVLANVADTYFQVLQFRDRLDVARRNLQTAEEVLRVVEARYDNGAVSRLDLAQQRTAVAQQKAAIPPLETQARQAQHALAVLLGVPPERVKVDAGSLATLVPPEVTPGLPSTLLARRPDIRAAEAKLLAANADIGAARAAFFPSIDLTGTYGFESASLSTLLDPVGTATRLAASLVQPIFEGGRLSGQLDLSKGRYMELAAGYRGTVLGAFADVEDALVAVRNSARQEALQQQVTNEAEEAYHLAQTRYRAGAVDILGLLDAQRSLYQAQDALAQVHLARLQAAVALYQALGGGWRAPERTAGPTATTG